MPAVDLSGSPQELLSLTAAAKRLRVNYRRLRAAVRSGDLPAYHVGGERSRVLWGEVVEWVRAQRVPPEGKIFTGVNSAVPGTVGNGRTRRIE